MFAFSIVSGRLADRWGRLPVILSGAALLGVGAFLVTLSPQVLPLAVGLFFLGLGWNFCYVGGSSLLSDQLAPAERSRTQGFNDLLIGLVSASGSLFSGLVFARLGYNMVAYAGLALSAVLGVVVWLGWRGRRPTETQAVRNP
jgi:MFS family permease